MTQPSQPGSTEAERISEQGACRVDVEDCYRVFQAVLQQAKQDILTDNQEYCQDCHDDTACTKHPNRPDLCPYAVRNSVCAKAWLESRGFEQWCEMLNLDPVYIRNNVILERKAQEERHARVVVSETIEAGDEAGASSS